MIISSYLLLNGLCVGFCEEVEESAAEIVCVAVGKSQLVGDGIQEQITAWR
jgi:hypothetical protein